MFLYGPTFVRVSSPTPNTIIGIVCCRHGMCYTKTTIDWLLVVSPLFVQLQRQNAECVKRIDNPLPLSRWMLGRFRCVQTFIFQQHPSELPLKRRPCLKVYQLFRGLHAVNLKSLPVACVASRACQCFIVLELSEISSKP